VRLFAVDAAAISLGLVVGMPLADAWALAPGLNVAEAMPEADAQALAALVDWCGRYSPWSATDGMDGIRLDITGCAHLFGGEAALVRDVECRLAGFGITTRGAIADNPAAAWAWARYRSVPDPILKSGDSLRNLPVSALRLHEETVRTLNGLGLATIGSIVALPRAPLSQRLGKTVLYRLDRLLGRDAEPISPRAQPVYWRVRKIFAEPIGRREDIDAVTLKLVEHLCRDLAEAGLGARRLELTFYRVDGTLQRFSVGASRATHAASHLARLFAERLDGVDPGFGIEAMVLEAVETNPLLSTQSALTAIDAVDEVHLAALIDRIQNRLGRNRVVQLVPVESHVPERAQRRNAALPSFRPVRGRPWPPKSARPLTLLPFPEPIEATAPIPDDPPVMFRWRRIVHRVAAADGPERIGPEWWTDKIGPPRDYYRVEDHNGRRFWVYREGLYGSAAPPRWFLHGFFP
jgi:protein ImuB